MGKQGKTATNKDNNISKMIALYYCHISPNMACFCKLMAQNWHKKLTSLARLADLRMHAVTVRNSKQSIYVIKVIIAGSIQHMSSIGLFYKNSEIVLGWCLTVKN